ncbi:hypothetical protein SEMRO_309_G113770.1 [Seminavis robusta]|uniref:Uncharacterized protein n=1 Tax=Seminavis robusta TaxID=568900 RepID=A0A9N8HAT7_9STRA|nr:hypothetical protein SEMRO_309_G113770.1 [Seminavis robusta]|eukprot:Sro309_g113770.1 n/a (493) ;mRNA; f:27704-29270
MEAEENKDGDELRAPPSPDLLDPPASDEEVGRPPPHLPHLEYDEFLTLSKGEPLEEPEEFLDYLHPPFRLEPFPQQDGDRLLRDPPYRRVRMAEEDPLPLRPEPPPNVINDGRHGQEATRRDPSLPQPPLDGTVGFAADEDMATLDDLLAIIERQPEPPPDPPDDISRRNGTDAAIAPANRRPPDPPPHHQLVPRRLDEPQRNHATHAQQEETEVHRSEPDHSNVARLPPGSSTQVVSHHQWDPGSTKRRLSTRKRDRTPATSGDHIDDDRKPPSRRGNGQTTTKSTPLPRTLAEELQLFDREQSTKWTSSCTYRYRESADSKLPAMSSSTQSQVPPSVAAMAARQENEETTKSHPERDLHDLSLGVTLGICSPMGRPRSSCRDRVSANQGKPHVHWNSKRKGTRYKRKLQFACSQTTSQHWQRPGFSESQHFIYKDQKYTRNLDKEIVIKPETNALLANASFEQEPMQPEENENSDSAQDDQLEQDKADTC